MPKTIVADIKALENIIIKYIQMEITDNGIIDCKEITNFLIDSVSEKSLRNFMNKYNLCCLTCAVGTFLEAIGFEDANPEDLH
jgi:hypothetical protein